MKNTDCNYTNSPPTPEEIQEWKGDLVRPKSMYEDSAPVQAAYFDGRAVFKTALSNSPLTNESNIRDSIQKAGESDKKSWWVEVAPDPYANKAMQLNPKGLDTRPRHKMSSKEIYEAWLNTPIKKDREKEVAEAYLLKLESELFLSRQNFDLFKQNEDILKAKLEKFEEAVNSLRQMYDIQSQKGNWGDDEYMRGLANGLILAVNLFQSEDKQLDLLFPIADKALHKKRYG